MDRYKDLIFGLIIFSTVVNLLNCSQNTGKKQATMQEEHYSLKDFRDVEKIDVHAHINTEDTWMIDEARANRFRLMVMAVDVVPEYPPMHEQLRVRIQHYLEHPDVFIFSTAFTLDGWDEPDWSERVIEKLGKDFQNGAVGVKVWKNIGMDARDKNSQLIMLDDPKFDSIFHFIKARNKVLISHAGEPKNCWLPLDQMTVKNDYNYFSTHPEFHMFLHPEFPTYEQQMEARNKMLDKNPSITFIGAHLASLEWSVDEIAKFLDHYPHAFVDLAERISHLQFQSQKDYQKVRNFMTEYQDRILYGTDFQQLEDSDPALLKKNMNERWILDWKYFNTDEIFTVPELDEPVQGLSLPKNIVDKIYRVNAENIFPDAWKARNQ
jgi:predicted TIM-barrel fold metal-dependent hydrolase